MKSFKKFLEAAGEIVWPLAIGLVAILALGAFALANKFVEHISF
jgi:hypothetical protein